MKIRLILDPETTERLAQSACEELRPNALQAEVLLRRILGTWNPDEKYINIQPLQLSNENSLSQ